MSIFHLSQEKHPRISTPPTIEVQDPPEGKSLLGFLIHKSARLGALAQQRRFSAADLQEKQLLALLRTARQTAFGKYHHFRDILAAPDPLAAFQQAVPAGDYQMLYDRWWVQAHLCDAPDVCWPGTIPYFALTSGTSQAATKYVPVTETMLQGMKRGSRRLFCDLAHFGLPPRIFAKQTLMVGSCTAPRREGRHFSGDLSGIIGQNRPLWMERYYRPHRDITDLPDWGQRIERIADQAPRWQVGFAVGNPMWVQLVLERIIERHGLRHIHELWPDFGLYVHGGVFFEPYRASFEALLGRPVRTADSYMASEGFFGYQPRPGISALRLLPDCGVFFEFVPFNEANFDENGDLRAEQPPAFTLDNLREGQPYALLISTCAGAWRYLLGDVVQFTNVARAEFRLVGRTKQFLSVCGEHLSIDNLNEAVRRTDASLKAGIREFCVGAVREGSGWAHEWLLSMDNPRVSATAFAQAVDAELCRLNEDYEVERRYALTAVRAQILPNAVFLEWLGQRGKLNGQAKIPRVLKGQQLADFKAFAGRWVTNDR